MAGINRIWRIGDSASSALITDGAAEIIEFDEATVSTNQQYFRAFRSEISRDVSQTNSLKGDVNPSQDGGVGSVRLYINGVMKNGTNKSNRKLFIKWLLNDGFTTNFPHGRYGTVFGNYPEFDVQPLGTAAPTGYGWLIEDGEISHDSEYKDKSAFSLTLKYNGNKSGITDNL